MGENSPQHARPTTPTFLRGGRARHQFKMAANDVDDAWAALRLLGLTPTLVSRLLTEKTNLTANEAWRKPVRVHPHSRSVLQDVFVRLHGLMYDSNLLPLSSFGEGRGRGARNFKLDVVARNGLTGFVREFGRLVPAGSTCMEWDELHYVRFIKGCDQTRANTYHFKTGAPLHIEKYGPSGAPSLVGSLLRIDNNTLATFDAIVCTQVFEHLPQPFAAAAALHRLLKPGGLLYWTAPFMQRYHAMPGDYFRFTPEGALELFTRSGFAVRHGQVIGDDRIVTGVDMGFGMSDFPAQYLASRLRANWSRRSVAPRSTQFINVALVLVRR